MRALFNTLLGKSGDGDLFEPSWPSMRVFVRGVSSLFKCEYTGVKGVSSLLTCKYTGVKGVQTLE